MSDNMDQALEDQIFSHHAQSSCSIGLNGTNSCVDSSFRVHGVESLRVVDASVFPIAMGGFPILPTFMISEETDVILGGLSNA
ncbi:hypothetical protein EJ02DRAFT_460254 [Clathrospora elynae]|uniref:Glucose-methanol-choline oxidoreductase C-terminal domain-containing protein n=1 Tax=Clathrospora elynae TaxID=706981 RepID=A0A6A5S672_9PLEO|nr:hypothetical protein EJ02DRAFT_460254 [Clathrospora elynae]